jgi:hypothetical protein
MTNDDDKPLHTADLVMKQLNVKGDYYENNAQRSYLRHLAMMEAEISDLQAITNEYHYFFRFWWFDDDKIREQMIKFKKIEGITDFRIKFLRFTGHLKISEEVVNYKLNSARPWMGWSLIAIVTIKILVGLLLEFTTTPQLSHNLTPHLQLLSLWALNFGILYLFFIAPSNFLKRKGVY